MISDFLKFLYKVFYKKVSKIVIILFISIIFTVIIFRGAVIKVVLDNKIKLFNQKYDAKFSYEDITVKRLTSIYIDGVDLKHNSSNKILHADKLNVSFEFWKLLIGRISIDNFSIENLTLNFEKSKDKDNYSFLYRQKNTAKDTSSEFEQNYAKSARKIFTALFDILPSNLKISKFLINFNFSGHEVKVFSNEINVSDELEKNHIFISEDSMVKSWIVESTIEKSRQKISVKIYTPSSVLVNLPFINKRWGMTLSADTIRFFITSDKFHNDLFKIDGRIAASGLRLFHKRISQDTVKFAYLDISGVFNFGKDFVEIDSATTITSGNFSVNPYACYKSIPTKQITLSLNKKQFASEQFFESLPEGLFTNFKGIRTSGNLNFHLFFNIDFSLPDSLKFESDLTSHNFKVIKYGETDFRKINNSFEYTAYDKGVAVRSFLVGPENPNFRTISEIPLNLQNAILMSEDGWFYYHKGFLPAAFRESMVTNIKERRFARGGSTITMQLVKNVFLNKNKNISRKVEEAGIVWMIENMHLCSKEKLFEVYMNIIEWGPGIYGANEAAHFYFNKDVSKLTLSECMFLAGIIPSPKGFKYAFNEDESLRDYMLVYFQKVADKLLEHDMINESEFKNLRFEVSLKGPAKDLLKKKDLSVPTIDSLNRNIEILFE
jgi:hypothetical protein